MSGWALVSTTTNSVAAATNSPSTVDVQDFFLPSGISGMAIQAVNFQHKYT
jgi:hypothetical protein